MRVGIIGVGQMEYNPKPHLNIPEMVYLAVTEALKDAHMEIKDIEYAVTSSVDLWDGKTASGVYITEVIGAVMKPETRVANDGLFAVAQAYMVIRSGLYKTSLVVSHCKASESSHFELSNWVFDPVYEQLLGLDYLSSSALQANAYMSRYGLREEDFALVVVKNRKNGTRNPFVGTKEVSVEEVLNSESIAYPIKELEVPPVSDGACALILASEDLIREMSGILKPVWIKGWSYCTDSHYLGDRDLSDSRSLRIAAQRAYKMAGIKNPAKEIDVAEISEEFSYQELLWSECLGFCEPGGGTRLLRSGKAMINGEIPINPSGGILSGNPPFVAGLIRLAEATLQLRGDAGKHQVKGARTALAHGTSGPAGQSHCVMVIGKD